jgi:hypothetical protein
MFVPELGADALRQEFLGAYWDRLKRHAYDFGCIDVYTDEDPIQRGRIPEFPADCADRARSGITAAHALEFYMRAQVSNPELSELSRIYRALHLREQDQYGADARSEAKIRRDCTTYMCVAPNWLARTQMASEWAEIADLFAKQKEDCIEQNLRICERELRLAKAYAISAAKLHLIPADAVPELSGIEPLHHDPTLPGANGGLTPEMLSWLNPGRASKPAADGKRRGAKLRYDSRTDKRVWTLWKNSGCQSFDKFIEEYEFDEQQDRTMPESYCTRTAMKKLSERMKKKL